MPEPLDIENPTQLLHYLRRTQRISLHESPTLTTLAGGVSNRTVLVTRPTGESWVLKQALSKLRVKVDWFSDPRRIEREAIGMRRLSELAPGCIPQLIFLDAEQHLLAMQAIAQPHENWKSMLLAGTVNADHVSQFAQLLGRIHRGGWEDRAEFAIEFDDRSFFESLRIEPYYLYSGQQAPEAAKFLHKIVADTRATRYTLVHGDYSPKNILVHNNRLILLDHEVIHFGDGAFDLGFSLAHLLSKGHHLRDHRDEFAAAATQYWAIYLQAIGDVPWRADLEPRAIRHVLACLLARCVGRSPLEYLSDAEREKQREVVLQMMQAPHQDINSMIQEFVTSICA